MAPLRLVRTAIRALWLVVAVAAFGLALASAVAPATGHRLVVIEGPSMGAAVPIGSVAIEAALPAGGPAVGDVVTFRTDNGTRITHRVTDVVPVSSGLALRTRGDANADPDPVLIPAASVEGVVVGTVPVVGYLLAFLSMPTGMLAVLAGLGALLSAAWLLDEVGPVDHDETEDDRPIIDGLPA